jgi:hypothetical protein
MICGVRFFTVSMEGMMMDMDLLMKIFAISVEE